MTQIYPEDETDYEGPSLESLIPAPELRSQPDAWPNSPYGKHELLLLYNIKLNRLRLLELQEEANCTKLNGACDGIYRFYHQSFKVFYLQNYTRNIVKLLRDIAPRIDPADEGEVLNEMFLQIISEGTGKVFEMSHNLKWMEVTRPILEAFFHAKYFLDMMVTAGEKVHVPQQLLDEGWASVLYLYNLR